MENNYLEVSARTVDEAVDEALKRLGATKEEVEVTVIKKGREGILGLGKEEAVIGVQRVKPAATAAPPEVAEQDTEKVALGIIEELLRILELKATAKVIRPASPDEPLSFDIKGEDLGILIGRRGQALADFQFMVRLMVAHRLQSWSPLSIDVEGYKKRRIESLRALALRLADQVRVTRRPMVMEPMPADERRIVHLTLANHPDVKTQSTGEGESRKVSIIYKR